MKIAQSILLISLLFFLSCSCHQTENESLFQLMDDTGISFENKVVDNKEENSFQFRNFYNGGGVATGDLNNDGLADVILTSNTGSNKIFINKGNFKFEDITSHSGLEQKGQWSTGVTLVDINHDGWLDIYICNSGHMLTDHRKNQLYINNHDLTFTESAAAYGLDHSGYCTQAAFFDYDLDGDLDCFLIDNSPIPFNTLSYANMRDSAASAWKVPEQYQGGGNHLLRNDGGHFTEVTRDAGIHTSLISFGLGISISDINGDGYPDIYIGNDFLERDYLYINQKNGTFKDELLDWFQHISMSSMGTDIADMNNDGYPDIYTTDMLPEDDYRFKTTGVFDNVSLYRSKVKAGYFQQYVRNCLQINNKNGKFIDVANHAGVAATDWSWGLVLFDADNDGFNDIYVCNGINHDLSNLDFLDFFSNEIYQRSLQEGKKEDFVNELVKRIPRTALLNKAYRNMGNLHFEDIGEKWGFTQPSFSNSVAYADLDNDGDLDLVINNENQPAFVYRNNARSLNKNHYIAISLRGNGENRFAIGSRVRVYSKGQIFYRELQPVRGFQSSVEYKMTIGLGASSEVDSMIIYWPNLTRQKFVKPQVDREFVIDQAKSDEMVPLPDRAIPESPLFEPVKTSFEKHSEDDYVDFYREANIPEMLSREGPKAAVGDVNGDGLEDIYIGGATGQGGQLYIQKTDGSFEKRPEKIFDQFAGFEDVAVIFFDCDGDGDLDLFIGSGGNTVPANSRQLQFRLYKNDGKGNFSLDPSAFPNNSANTSVAITADFNLDGHPDLFIGSRSVPLQYGLDPPSHVFINDGKGHFKEMEKSSLGALANLGMVSDAIWTDINADGEKELIVVGDWMAPRIFAFRKNHFEEIQTNLNQLYGWWRMVLAADLNQDGKQDIVLGNIGDNFYLHPDAQHPVKIWINDFDQNNVLDKIMTHVENGRDLPVFLKHDMEAQLPSLKKQNLLHEDFAKKSIQELFPKSVLDASLVKKFNYTTSILAINQGNGQFLIKPLPDMIQLSSVNAGLAEDLDGDGITDLILGGNDFNFTPQFGRLDASLCSVLINRKNGSLETLDSKKSGIQETGQIRDIKGITVKGKKYILILQNDEYPVLYRKKDPAGLVREKSTRP
ncbi:MAG: VCBS repeat-containing protein [Chitinophagales bacterium]